VKTLAKPSTVKKVEVALNPEEDEFWLSFGKSLISGSIDILDNRAQFMIRTSASLIAVDFAILVIASKVALLTVSPQFLFAFSVFCFTRSLVPIRYQVNPWLPDETKSTHLKILNAKHKWHLRGFSSFLLGLILVALSSFLTIS